MKKLLKYISILILGLLVALLLVPFLFKSQVIDMIKDQGNQYINGTMDFDDVHISFLRNFPDVNVEIKNLSIRASKAPEKDQLVYAANTTAFDINLSSFINKEQAWQVNSVFIDQGKANLQTYLDGSNNYSLLKGGDHATAQAFDLELKRYEIQNSNFIFQDHQSNLFLSANSINHQGSGAFTESLFDLKHQTDIDAMTLRLDNIDYLKHAHVQSEMITQIDRSSNTYSFDSQALKINDLSLLTNGSVQVLESQLNLDLEVKSSNEKLSDLISAIPLVFKENISDLKMNGYASVFMILNGTLNTDKATYPELELSIKTKDGAIQSSRYPEKITALNSDIRLHARQSDWSDLMVQIPAFSFNLDDEKFIGKFVVEDLSTNPRYELLAQGDIQLKKLQHLLSIPNVEHVDGDVSLDLDFSASQQDLDNLDYDKIRFANRLSSDRLTIKLDNKPELTIQDLDIHGTTDKITIQEFESNYGKSDFQIDGTLHDPLNVLYKGEPSNGNVNIRSKLIDLNEITSASQVSDSVKTIVVPDNLIQLDYMVEAEKINYENYRVEDSKASGKVDVNSLEIRNMSGTINGSNIQGRGQFKNTYPYIMGSDTLYGELKINSKRLNLDNFISTTEGASEAELTRIPRDISLILDADAQQLSYEKYDLQNVSSQIILSKGVAILTDGKADAFDGSVDFEGAYYTHTEDPSFSMKYDIETFNFQDFYKSANSFQKLAPIAEYITGHFNSNLSMSGKLSDGFQIDLASLSADGFLETLDSKIEGFKPLEEMANTLGVAEIKKFAIENTKNWLQVKEGSVIIKPQDYDFSGIKMNIGGSHHISQSINYLAHLQIPRDLFKDGGAVVAQVDQGLDKLSKEASNLGVDIFSGDYIYLKAELTGSVLKPKVKITPTGSGGKNLTEEAKDALTDRAGEIKDEITNKVEDKIDETKDTLSDIVNEKVDEVNSKADSIIDEKVDVVVDTLSNILSDQIDSTLTGVLGDTLQSEIKDQLEDILDMKGTEVDKIKDKLKDFDIFKKKKGN